jgi:hypothetical protein
MTRTTIAGGAFATVLVLLLALAVRNTPRGRDVEPRAATPTAIASSTPAAAEVRPGFLYGRITADDDVTYEGRLRWGRDQEAVWGDYFNGVKVGNAWAGHVPGARRPLEIFGVAIGGQDRSINLVRQFMARFGDIARVEPHFGTVRVTLKSGTLFELDRFSAGDIDDGVRVWDGRRGVVDLDARRIRTIEFLPTAPLVAAPGRLHGTVRARQRDFTGFVQWDEQDGLTDDELVGRTANGELNLRYGAIRSIARRSRDSAVVTQLDGRELVLSGTREVGQRNRGIYVDDPRYGRVLVSWDAFERVDFSPADSGPGYGDFQPGRALAGSVTTRAGRRLAGRLVYDFDESETTETLDAAREGVDYFIPFSLITSIVRHGGSGDGDARRTTVILRSGEEVQLEPTGDLGDRNAGLLIFVDGRDHPEYVPWNEVEQIDFDRAPAMHPSPGGR